MNTEQLKTAEEIATIIWASKHCGSSHVQLIENFASQESKIAVEKDRESRWISVKDRLPDEGIDVWVCLNDDTILMGRLLHDGWSAFFRDGLLPMEYREVTHWQPLPSPPTLQ